MVEMSMAFQINEKWGKNDLIVASCLEMALRAPLKLIQSEARLLRQQGRRGLFHGNPRQFKDLLGIRMGRSLKILGTIDPINNPQEAIHLN